MADPAAFASSNKGKGKVQVPNELPSPSPPAQDLQAGARTAEDEPRILPVGFDMSLGLLGIASSKGHETIRGDCFDMSMIRSGVFVSNSSESNGSRRWLTPSHSPSNRTTLFLSPRFITLPRQNAACSRSRSVSLDYPSSDH